MTNSILNNKWLIAVLISTLLLLPLRMGFAMNMDMQDSDCEKVCMHDMHKGEQAMQMPAGNACDMGDGCAGQCLDCSHCQIVTLPLSLDTVSFNASYRVADYIFRSHEYIALLDIRPPRQIN